MVWGSTPIDVVRSSPRYPTIPPTADQLSLVLMRLVFDQFWENGIVCAVLSARNECSNRTQALAVANANRRAANERVIRGINGSSCERMSCEPTGGDW